MTAYCTKADMQARFDTRTLVQLTDRPADDTVAPATTITDSVLDQAIADAGSTIDGYVGVVHTLPLTDLPPILIQHACNLALYNLYRDATPDQVTKRHDAAIAFLRDVAANKVRLFADDRPEEGTGAGLVETSGPERRYTAKTLRGAL
jgi:phage gp36-like protein